MKVKIGNKIYNSEEEPIMIIFDNDDKDNISHMAKDAMTYCSFPDTMSEDEVKVFMGIKKESSKRLLKKADELKNIQQRNNINIMKQEINKLNRDLQVERQDLEDVVGVTPMGDLALNIIDQAKYIEERCYKVSDALENNPEAQDYIYDLMEDLVEQDRINEHVMESDDPAGLLVNFIDKVFQVNQKYLNM